MATLFGDLDVFFSNFFFFMCMSVFLDCVSVLTECMLVPLEARREHWISQNQSYRWLLGNEPMSSGRAAVLKTAEPFIAHTLFGMLLTFYLSTVIQELLPDVVNELDGEDRLLMLLLVSWAALRTWSPICVCFHTFQMDT